MEFQGGMPRKFTKIEARTWRAGVTVALRPLRAACMGGDLPACGGWIDGDRHRAEGFGFGEVSNKVPLL